MSLNNEKNQLSKQVEKVVSLCNGRDIKQVVNDLMQMFCNLISEPRLIEVAFNNTLWKCNEDFRLELSYYKKYPKAWEELQMLSTMFMQAIKNSEPFSDLIGDLYDMQLRGNKLGQFLTPHDVADALAQFNIITKEQPEAFKVYSVSEPCVGAGGLILGFIRNYYQAYGKGATKNLDVHINDLDIHMVKMATVQIVLNSIIHRIPIHRLTATHANVITEYEDMNMGKKDLYVWLPDANKTSLMKMIDEKFEYVEKENEQLEKEVKYA